MFQPVPSKVSFPELEEAILRFWKEREIFRKSVEARPEERLYSFYEGPPTANALPHIGHVLTRVFKDVIPRYKTMRGYRVPRKGGWDTHGLPVELEVERELGLKSKADIEKFGIEEFNRRCRESVFRYVREWERLTERIGFWIDLENAYITFDPAYIESCWWILKQLWEGGLIYQDYRVTPHCPRCGTSLSDHEVALGYKEDTPDPSIYVKFPLTAEAVRRLGLPGDIPAYFLAWTTTPWTLPGNTALAVHPEADYVALESRGQEGPEVLILAAYLAHGLVEGEALARLPGSLLTGLPYEPLYRPEEGWGVEALAFQEGRLAPLGDRPLPPSSGRRVIAADFVSIEEGTGIIHIAPAFGQEDFEAGKAEGLLFLQPVDPRGEFSGGPWQGLFVKEADPLITEDLRKRGLLFRSGTILHTYPFCWRCDTPLLYFAKPTWYIRTTAIRELLIQGNEEVNWYPAHIKHGRFGDWLKNNVDWALSRERYWGTPLPLWRCQACGHYTCIGSLAELKERALDGEKVQALRDLHRPYVDEIELACPACGGTMRRVPEVIDCWFDSGAMPYAQWHYPFQNQEAFRQTFPADFICEAVDQTRGWFYTLHAEAALLKAVGAVPVPLAFRNVISLGHILDEQGRKMSKSLGNVVDPWTVIEAHGADALRWYLLTASPAGNPRRFSGELVAEVVRQFLLTLWNVYSFFVTYAIIDGFDPRTPPSPELSLLDRWLLAELHLLIERVTHYMDAYNPTDAGRALAAFVDDLSRWYVRRSRRRFWKSEDDADKLSAYQTLYTCLVTLAKLLAPFIPFTAEAMYQNLVRSWDAKAPESVHLCDWPQADPSRIDEGLMADMRLAMQAVSLGRAARSKAGIKVRQPLARATIRVRTEAEAEGLRRLAGEVAAELNVKAVEVSPRADLEAFAAVAEEGGYAVALDTHLTPELREEGLARELVHRLQNMRKKAGFEIADRICTYYQGDEAIRRVMERFADYIQGETLSRELIEGPPPPGAYVESQRIEGHSTTLAVLRLPTASAST